MCWFDLVSSRSFTPRERASFSCIMPIRLACIIQVVYMCLIYEEQSRTSRAGRLLSGLVRVVSSVTSFIGDNLPRSRLWLYRCAPSAVSTVRAKRLQFRSRQKSLVYPHYSAVHPMQEAMHGRLGSHHLLHHNEWEQCIHLRHPGFWSRSKYFIRKKQGISRIKKFNYLVQFLWMYKIEKRKKL